ncbi:hypothetical protein QQ045_025823 [Rhodiola kirilowii]
MPARYERLNRELLVAVHELEEEGVLDRQFLVVRSLKETAGPFFLAELIPSFKKDINKALRKLTDALEKPAVNFRQLDHFCLKIKGSSSCFGACRLVQAIVSLRKAIETESVDLCLTALEGVKDEWNYLDSKLSNILKLDFYELTDIILMMQIEIRLICHDDVVRAFLLLKRRRSTIRPKIRAKPQTLTFVQTPNHTLALKLNVVVFQMPQSRLCQTTAFYPTTQTKLL